MDAKTQAPEFVVTVLLSNSPIGVINLSQRGEHSSDVSIWYDSATDLRLIQTALVEAQSGVSYLLWKETGQIPPPPDYQPPEVVEPLPF